MRYGRHTLTRREFGKVLAAAPLALAAQQPRPRYAINGVLEKHHLTDLCVHVPRRC